MTELRKKPISGAGTRVFIPSLKVKGTVVASGRFTTGGVSQPARLLIVADLLDPEGNAGSNAVIVADTDGCGRLACRNTPKIVDFVWAEDDPLLQTIEAVREAGYMVTKKATLT